MQSGRAYLAKKHPPLRFQSALPKLTFNANTLLRTPNNVPKPVQLDPAFPPPFQS